MFYVYLIRSKKDDRWVYTGSTGDLRKRFAMHNDGLVPSTKLYRPFHLLYYESYAAEADARHREQNLKLRANAFNQLKRRLRETLKVH